MERAGWFSGVFSAVKLCQSVSISGAVGDLETDGTEQLLDALEACG
jgi:hypothetical protein